MPRRDEPYYKTVRECIQQLEKGNYTGGRGRLVDDLGFKVIKDMATKELDREQLKRSIRRLEDGSYESLGCFLGMAAAFTSLKWIAENGLPETK